MAPSYRIEPDYECALCRKDIADAFWKEADERYPGGSLGKRQITLEQWRAFYTEWFGAHPYPRSVCFVAGCDSVRDATGIALCKRHVLRVLGQMKVMEER